MDTSRANGWAVGEFPSQDKTGSLPIPVLLLSRLFSSSSRSVS
jgi:hypothetical protein